MRLIKSMYVVHLSTRGRVAKIDKDDSFVSTANVSTLWKRQNQEDVSEICETSLNPRTMEEAAGVNPQKARNRQNSEIYNS